MHKALLTLSLTTLLLGCNLDQSSTNIEHNRTLAGINAYRYLTELSSAESPIGARPTGGAAEILAANWISQKLTQWGYEVTRQLFTYQENGETMRSENLIVTLRGQSDQMLVLGAHYDSTGVNKGSLGVTDNGAGVAALLAVANALKTQTLPDNVRLVFFGAEENGTHGSKAYVSSLSPHEVSQIKGMINLDTIAGGDRLYIHSALSTPNAAHAYGCSIPNHYSFDPKLRDRLLTISQQGGMDPYRLHPANSDYPAGETGDWSDHAAFACQGIPVAYIEATNFSIDGKGGYDGYSQSTNPALWDCYNSKTNSACYRDRESQWGEIWHTGADRLERLNELFPGRVLRQISDGTALILKFLRDPKL